MYAIITAMQGDTCILPLGLLVIYLTLSQVIGHRDGIIIDWYYLWQRQTSISKPQKKTYRGLVKPAIHDDQTTLGGGGGGGGGGNSAREGVGEGRGEDSDDDTLSEGNDGRSESESESDSESDEDPSTVDVVVRLGN